MSEPKNPEPKANENWRQEAADCWRALPDKGLFLTLLGAWLALFHFLGNSTFGYVDTPSLLGWMYHAYNAPASEDGHGNLIPFVVLGLFWWKRAELMSVPKGTWWPGMILVVAALVFHMAGFIVQQPRLSIIGLFAGIYGLMGLVWGWHWLKASFFPFVLFAFCLPLGSLAESITFPLRMLVTQISVAVSHGFLGIDVVRDGSQIFDASRTYNYDVAAACSGIRSLISLLALTTIYGFITFKATWKRLFMVIIAVPLAVAGNVVRITGVIVAAEAFGQNAGAKVHDGAGFITFGVAIGCVMALSCWLREDPQVQTPLASKS